MIMLEMVSRFRMSNNCRSILVDNIIRGRTLNVCKHFWVILDSRVVFTKKSWCEVNHDFRHCTMLLNAQNSETPVLVRTYSYGLIVHITPSLLYTLDLDLNVDLNQRSFY